MWFTVLLRLILLWITLGLSSGFEGYGRYGVTYGGYNGVGYGGNGGYRKYNGVGYGGTRHYGGWSSAAPLQHNQVYSYDGFPLYSSHQLPIQHLHQAESLHHQPLHQVLHRAHDTAQYAPEPHVAVGQPAGPASKAAITFKAYPAVVHESTRDHPFAAHDEIEPTLSIGSSYEPQPPLIEAHEPQHHLATAYKPHSSVAETYETTFSISAAHEPHFETAYEPNSQLAEVYEPQNSHAAAYEPKPVFTPAAYELHPPVATVYEPHHPVSTTYEHPTHLAAAAAYEPQPGLAAAYEPKPVLGVAFEPHSDLAAAFEQQPIPAAAYEPNSPVARAYEPQSPSITTVYELAPVIEAVYESQPHLEAYEPYEPQQVVDVDVVSGVHDVRAQITDPASSYQFHAQDENGAAEYGYGNQNSAKHEIASPNGIVKGSYAYLDQAGHHQVNYIADHDGFRLIP